MKPIKSNEDIERYQSLFEGVWNSADITLSLLEFQNGTTVPNGEIVFRRDNKNDKKKTLYEFENLSVIRKVVSSPFDALKNLINGKLSIKDKKIDNINYIQAGYQLYFKVGRSDYRVFETRPTTELNRSFSVDVPDEVDYSDQRRNLGERMRFSDKPFYNVSDCETYYFDNYFVRSESWNPLLLLFADTGVQFDIIADNELKLKFPREMKDKLNLFIYPHSPYGEHKGRKMPIRNEECENVDGKDLLLSKKLDLEGIERGLISLTAEDEVIDSMRYRNPKMPAKNERYRIFNKYDQKGEIKRHLEDEVNTETFEIAVMNVLSIAGYRTQWFGEEDINIPNCSGDEEVEYGEIDIIAYSPDNSGILFVECTSKVGKKVTESDLQDRVSKLKSRAIDTEKEIEISDFERKTKETVTCIATPQSEKEIDSRRKNDLEKRGILLLHREKLINILETSSDTEGYVNVKSNFLGLKDKI